jgi:hypothetical protein
MAQHYRLINLQRHGNVACVRLAKNRLQESEIYELFVELSRLAREDSCPRIALCLGPQTPECMYSVFLAKLIGLQRRLNEIGGGLKLCECTPQVLDIFDACILRDRFDIVADPATAREQWGVA